MRFLILLTKYICFKIKLNDFFKNTNSQITQICNSKDKNKLELLEIIILKYLITLRVYDFKNLDMLRSTVLLRKKEESLSSTETKVQ